MTTGELRWYKIERFLKKNNTITNADVRQLFNVSSATSLRILASSTDEGKLLKNPNHPILELSDSMKSFPHQPFTESRSHCHKQCCPEHSVFA